MAERLKFALFGNIYQAKKSASVKQLISLLAARDAELYIDTDFYTYLSQELHFDVCPTGLISDSDFQADIAVSMGGDGTFLAAASRVGNKDIPILGINMGRLGFLASVLPEEFATAVEDIYQGRYRIDSRSVIGIETEGEPLGIYPYALNDISLCKRDFAAMITVRASVDGQYLNTYQADGLVVSTPTGSTAYSLSNGGPIVVPQSKVLTLTPVAPHSMSTRPIVLPDTSEIRLEVKSRSHNFMIAIDGEATKLHEGTVMTIRRAPYEAKMVVRGDITYFSTLREKLMWGADPRQ